MNKPEKKSFWKSISSFFSGKKPAEPKQPEDRIPKEPLLKRTASFLNPEQSAPFTKSGSTTHSVRKLARSKPTPKGELVDEKKWFALGDREIYTEGTFKDGQTHLDVEEQNPSRTKEIHEVAGPTVTIDKDYREELKRTEAHPKIKEKPGITIEMEAPYESENLDAIPTAAEVGISDEDLIEEDTEMAPKPLSETDIKKGQQNFQEKAGGLLALHEKVAKKRDRLEKNEQEIKQLRERKMTQLRPEVIAAEIVKKEKKGLPALENQLALERATRAAKGKEGKNYLPSERKAA